MDDALEDLDGSRMLQIGLGDELGDRDAEFQKWSRLAFQQAALDCNLDLSHEQTRNPQVAKTKLLLKCNYFKAMLTHSVFSNF